jgi:hypothetical protein
LGHPGITPPASPVRVGDTPRVNGSACILSGFPPGFSEVKVTKQAAWMTTVGLYMVRWLRPPPRVECRLRHRQFIFTEGNPLAGTQAEYPEEGEHSSRARTPHGLSRKSSQAGNSSPAKPLPFALVTPNQQVASLSESYHRAGDGLPAPLTQPPGTGYTTGITFSH